MNLSESRAFGRPRASVSDYRQVNGFNNPPNRYPEMGENSSISRIKEKKCPVTVLTEKKIKHICNNFILAKPTK